MAKRVTCIHTVRGTSGRVEKYGLADQYGRLIELTPKEVKDCIRNGSMVVDNLKITSDGRLITSYAEKNKLLRQANKAKGQKNIK